MQTPSSQKHEIEFAAYPTYPTRKKLAERSSKRVVVLWQHTCTAPSNYASDGTKPQASVQKAKVKELRRAPTGSITSFWNSLRSALLVKASRAKLGLMTLEHFTCGAILLQFLHGLVCDGGGRKGKDREAAAVLCHLLHAL